MSVRYIVAERLQHAKFYSAYYRRFIFSILSTFLGFRFLVLLSEMTWTHRRSRQRATINMSWHRATMRVAAWQSPPMIRAWPFLPPVVWQPSQPATEFIQSMQRFAATETGSLLHERNSSKRTVAKGKGKGKGKVKRMAKPGLEQFPAAAERVEIGDVVQGLVHSVMPYSAFADEGQVVADFKAKYKDVVFRDLVDLAGVDVGDVVEGVLLSVTETYGLVDIDGLKGLLFRPQLSHARVATMKDVLSPRERIKAMVIQKDIDRCMLTLSTKDLEQNYGDMLRNRSAVFETAEEMAQVCSKSSREEREISDFKAKHGSVEVGDLVEGVVLAESPVGVWVDVWDRGSLLPPLIPKGRISYAEYADLDVNKDVFSIGDRVKALVVENDADCGNMILSTKELEQNLGDMLRNRSAVFENAEEMARLFRGKNPEERAIDDFKAKYGSVEVGDLVEGVVHAVVPHGALVDVWERQSLLPPLLPKSQISHAGVVAVEDVLSPGDRIKALVIKKDTDRGRLSLSTKKLEQNHGDMLRNRSAVFETAEEMVRVFRESPSAQREEEEATAALDHFITASRNLKVGDVVEGVVLSVTENYTLIDIEGVMGKLSKFQFSYEYIATMEDVLSPGDKLRVLILKKDVERGRLALSTRELELSHGDMLRNRSAVFDSAEKMGQLFRVKNNRWAAAIDAVHVGDVVEGVVRSVTETKCYVHLVRGVSPELNFSVSVMEEVLAVLPKSEISHAAVVNIGDVFSIGDRIKAFIIQKDAHGAALSLSTKKLEQNHGDILRNRSVVFEGAEEMGRQVRARREKQGRFASDIEWRTEDRVMLKHFLAVSSNISVGDVVEGVVLAVAETYVLVDINGLKGLLLRHLISHAHIATMKDVFSPRERIKALVCKKNVTSRNVILSTKELEQHHGDMLYNRSAVFETAEEMGRLFRERSFTKKKHRFATMEDVKVGAVVEGVVQSVREMYSLVDVAGMVCVLPKIQISYAADFAIKDVLAHGDRIQALVIQIDVARDRLTLNTKELEHNRGDMLRNRSAVFETAEEMGRRFRQKKSPEVGDVVEGVVNWVTPFGAQVDIGASRIGFLRKLQMTLPTGVSVSRVVSLGDRIKALVITADADRGNFALRMKEFCFEDE